MRLFPRSIARAWVAAAGGSLLLSHAMPARAGFGPPLGSEPASTPPPAPKKARREEGDIGAPSAAPAAPDAPPPARHLTPYQLATFSDEAIFNRASAVPRVEYLPPPIANGTHLWNPLRMQADAAPAQKAAWKAVFPDERFADYTRCFTNGRLTFPDSSPCLDAPQLLQPGVECGRIQGNCGWHVLHEVNQLKGKLFKQEASRAHNLAQFKTDFDAYRKRIGFASMAPVAFDALMIKLVRVYKERELADWCARARAHASGQPRLRMLRPYSAVPLDPRAPGWRRRRRCRSRTLR